MLTLSELEAQCRSWLDDPAHKPRFDHPGVGQDQYDLHNTRRQVCEIMFACAALRRNRNVLQVLRDAAVVKELLG